MSSTITIQETINWELSYLEQQPVKINGMEPALSAANLVMEALLSPPLAWPWNRSTLNFTGNGQDFTALALNNFGYLEGGTYFDSQGAPWEMNVKKLLHLDQSGSRPLSVNPLIDDGLGNITFRFSPAPAATNFDATLVYQRKQIRIFSLATTWSPVPDEKNYMCQWGHLSMMSLIGNDARFNQYNQKFVTAVLSSHGGLTAMERNMFLANWTNSLSQLQGTQLETQERFKAREV